MTQTTDHKRRSAYSRWLRTGRLPPIRSPEGVEFKFNPWHDSVDGRFTFAGSGQYFDAGGTERVNRAGGIAGRHNPRKQRIATRPNAEGPRAEESARLGKKPRDRGATEPRPKSVSEPPPSGQPNAAVEFVGGFGEGLYDVAKGTVAGVYSALTTNPVTTVRNAGRNIAGVIDTAIAAEDTPARIQVSRAADAIANASPRELGRATGVVAGNAALAVAPGATFTKVSALRRLRVARPRVTYEPPQIGWAKENLGRDSPAKLYNDAAIGARPGQAPTLMRTMPDGSKRPVKFDGVEGDFLIDRKWSVRDQPRARAQLLRQSNVLAQHRLIGIWEVPNEVERIAALKLFKKMNVTNIKVRVAKP